MIIVTGAAGFIGSALIRFLNDQGINEIILVDHFLISSKKKNWINKKKTDLVERKDLFNFLSSVNKRKIKAIFHLGARTDTTEKEWSIFEKLNFSYSKKIWNYAVENDIPFIYASSAATYGDGKNNFLDSHEIISDLIPLNPYGKSKNDFDKFVLTQEKKPSRWYGFKFFNVYGPNEYHKGRMASVIFHTYNQIQKTGRMNLFRSHHKDYKDGEQSRDFIYIKDVVSTLFYFYENNPKNGIYNLGTGKARTFYDLASAVFNALDLNININFIDTPIDIRDTYQYFTEADLNKLTQEMPLANSFFTLENGINDYVKNYLIENKIY